MPRTTCTGIGIARHPNFDDRMVAVLKVDDADGRAWIIDLDVDDLKALLADLRTLLSADQPTVDRWWRQLANGRDHRPRAAVRP
jgi:hypothetical protein